MIIKEFKEDTAINKRIEWIKDCLSHKDHLTVFKLDETSTCTQLDEALLQSLLKGT